MQEACFFVPDQHQTEGASHLPHGHRPPAANRSSVFLRIDSIAPYGHGAVMSAEPITELILETFRLNGRLLAAGDTLVGDVGLTSARWQVLGAVAMVPGPLPVAHIARIMGLTRQTVQRTTNELEAQGLIRFAPNPHHQRAKLVLLTDRGRATYEVARQRQEPWAASLTSGLTAKQIEAATGVLRRVRQRLEAGERT